MNLHGECLEGFSSNRRSMQRRARSEGQVLFRRSALQPSSQMTGRKFRNPIDQKGFRQRIDGMELTGSLGFMRLKGLSTKTPMAALILKRFMCENLANLISRVTDAVLEEVSLTGKTRALEPVYPIVFPDALTGQNPRCGKRARLRTRPFMWLWASPHEGEREVPGLWIASNEGAKFWLSIMNNLKNRGLEDHPDCRR